MWARGSPCWCLWASPEEALQLLLACVGRGPGLWVPGQGKRPMDCSWRERLPGASDSVPASPGPPLDRNCW